MTDNYEDILNIEINEKKDEKKDEIKDEIEKQIEKPKKSRTQIINERMEKFKLIRQILSYKLNFENEVKELHITRERLENMTEIELAEILRMCEYLVSVGNGFNLTTVMPTANIFLENYVPEISPVEIDLTNYASILNNDEKYMKILKEVELKYSLGLEIDPLYKLLYYQVQTMVLCNAINQSKKNRTIIEKTDKLNTNIIDEGIENKYKEL